MKTALLFACALMLPVVARAQDAPEVAPVEVAPVEVAPQVDAAQKIIRLRALPLGDLLRDGQASASTSENDIGTVANVFDGDAKTLCRSKEINPQQTVIEFPTPISVRALRVMISHHAGQWRVEAINEGAKRELVPWTKAGDGEWVLVVLPRDETATAFRLIVQRIGGDEYVHLNEWELLQESPEVPAPVEQTPAE